MKKEEENIVFYEQQQFFLVSMQTIINEEGIYIKIFPFTLKYKYFAWDNIAKSYVRKYNPIKEYGGWGMRSGLIRVKFGLLHYNSLLAGLTNGRAYSISGNMGLQLEFENGKKILIGTHKPEELENALKKLGKYITDTDA